MGLFGGLKWDRKRLMPGDPSEMRMDAMRYDDAGNLMPGGLVQGGDVTTERMPGYLQGGDEYTGRDLVAQILAGISDVADRQGGGQGGMMDGQMQFRISAIEMAKKQAEDQLQKQALMEAARQRGINPADVTLAQGGLGSIIPKGDEPTAFMRNEQYVGDMYGPEAAKAYAVPGLYGMTRGPDGRMYPITPSQAPDTLSDDEWNALPGGASGNARGGFPIPRYRR